jgi:hypothetical protein
MALGTAFARSTPAVHVTPAGGDDPLVRRLGRTLLARLGGSVRASLLDDRTLAALQEEAANQAVHAGQMLVARRLIGDGYRGDPDRWLDSAPGGLALHAFYHAPNVLELLRSLTGLSWQTTGEAGSFSYYRRPGHHLGLHRDIESCELAIITCLRDDRPLPGSAGGVLCLYPSRSAEPLADIQESLDTGPVEVRLVPGQSMVLLGGIVPHRLTSVTEGQARIITPLCYRTV